MTFTVHDSIYMEQHKSLSQNFLSNSPNSVTFFPKSPLFSVTTQTSSASTELGVKHLMFSKIDVGSFLQRWLHFCALFP